MCSCIFGFDLVWYTKLPGSRVFPSTAPRQTSSCGPSAGPSLIQGSWSPPYPPVLRQHRAVPRLDYDTFILRGHRSWDHRDISRCWGLGWHQCDINPWEKDFRWKNMENDWHHVTINGCNLWLDDCNDGWWTFWKWYLVKNHNEESCEHGIDVKLMGITMTMRRGQPWPCPFASASNMVRLRWFQTGAWFHQLVPWIKNHWPKHFFQLLEYLFAWNVLVL